MAVNSFRIYSEVSYNKKFNELCRGGINLNKKFFLSNYLNIDLKIIQMFYRYPRMQNNKILIKENIVFFFNFIKAISLTKNIRGTNED